MLFAIAWIWMNLEDVLLSEINLTQEHKYYLISYVESTKVEPEAESRVIVVRGCG